MRLRPLAFAAPLLVPIVATTLSAQRVVRRVPPPDWDASTIPQTVTIDLAEAVQNRYAATIEPLVFGRFSIGLSGEYTTTRDGSPYGSPYPVADCPLNRGCSDPVYPGAAPGPSFREWSFAVRGRWYPEALTRANARQSIAAYVGEFVGYRQRRSSETIYYPCAACTAIVPDSGVFYPPGGGGTTVTTTTEAWEPGAELGVRIVAARHLVIDVGGSFRVVRLDDFQSSTRRGDVDSRLKVAIGFGW